jgi:hypothetical protein
VSVYVVPLYGNKPAPQSKCKNSNIDNKKSVLRVVGYKTTQVCRRRKTDPQLPEIFLKGMKSLGENQQNKDVFNSELHIL